MPLPGFEPGKRRLKRPLLYLISFRGYTFRSSSVCFRCFINNPFSKFHIHNPSREASSCYCKSSCKRIIIFENSRIAFFKMNRSNIFSMNALPVFCKTDKAYSLLAFVNSYSHNSGDRIRTYMEWLMTPPLETVPVYSAINRGRQINRQTSYILFR